MELFDQAGHLSRRSPRKFSPGFACDSVLASFLNSPRYTFDLRRGDEGSLAYLACTNPSRLPVPSLSGLRYTHYSAHWVLMQFGFLLGYPTGVQRGNAFSSIPGSIFKASGLFLLVAKEPPIRGAKLSVGSLCFQWLYWLLEKGSEVLELCWLWQD